MSMINNNLLLTASGSTSYQITRSLRFNASDSAYLSRTPSVAGNRKTWTWAGWVKRSALGVQQTLISAGAVDNQDFFISFESDNTLRILEIQDSSFLLAWKTTQVFCDTSAWFHLVIVINTTEATSTNRVKIFVNGSILTSYSSQTTPAQNTDLDFNTAAVHGIGRRVAATTYFNGYLADVHFIDGQALDPSSFTTTDLTTGQLIPKAYSGGSYGTNGFQLKFADNSSNTATTLGKDTSPNGNNWTPNNLSIITGGPTSVASASGALPVYNTTDTYGTTKGTGTRTDSNSSSIVLAIPMDGANNGTTFTDESATIKGSGSAKAITRNGAVTSTTQSKFYGSSGFFDGIDDHLTTPDSNDFALGSGDFTIEFFINPSATASKGLFGIIGSGASTASTAFVAQLTSTNTLFFSAGDGSGETNFTSTAVFTAGTWNHGAIVRNGSTVNFYFNGVLNTSISFTRTISDQSTPFTIGRLGDYVGAGYYNGYIQDFRVYKGVAKYTSNFNPPSSTQTATIAAGNDSLVDTPTSYGTDTGVGGEVRGNYCTLNPLQSASAVTLTNGNLDWVTTNATSFANAVGLIGMASGKWYCEITISQDSSTVGICKSSIVLVSNPANDANAWAYFWNGNKTNNGSDTSYGASYTTGDVIGIAFDADAGSLVFYKNGSGQGTAFTSLTNGPYFIFVGDQSTPGVGGGYCNFGQRPFAYTAPSGFKSLCDTNLPTPVVAKPSTVMNAILDTGANILSAAQAALSGGADLLWIKDRANANNHQLIDTVRGGTATLQSNTTAAETTYSAPSGSSVAWCWDAGTGSPVSNTAGSITSQVRANASAGFSVVTYTGTGANASVGHGLNVAPSLIIIKSRTQAVARNWAVYHASLGATKILELSTTNAAQTVNFWQDTAPTSSVFTLSSQGDVNASTYNYVAYCFSPVVGYSSMSSYVGTGSADGSFVYTGFRPRWILRKRSDSTGNWGIVDTTRLTYNLDDTVLFADLSLAEQTSNPNWGIDVLSNGFKVRSSDPATNASGATYIYAAFAESPFQYARAR